MYQTLGDILGNAIVLVIFIYLSLVLLGKVKMRKPIKAFEDPTLFIKILVFGGTIIFAVLLVISLVGKK